FFFFFSSRRRHTRLQGDWSSDVCSSDLLTALWARASSREKSTKTLRSIVPISAINSRDLRQRLGKRIRPWLTCWARSRSGRRRHPLRSHSLGCLPKSHGSFPFQAPQSSRVWRRTSEQRQSN